jgi:hypothetical protein
LTLNNDIYSYNIEKIDSLIKEEEKKLRLELSARRKTNTSVSIEGNDDIKHLKA